MSNKSNLIRAKLAKDDEFYTRLEDIELELNHYKKYFKDKVIYLPCDGENSNFLKYFRDHQNELKFKQLIATSYNPSGRGKCFCIGPKTAQFELFGDGDFRSDEVKQYWDAADIIITNPPFSLFREFYNICKNKNYIIIGSNLISTYIDVEPALLNNKLKFGYNRKDMIFIRPDKSLMPIKARWYTNLDIAPDIKFNNFRAVSNNILFPEFTYKYKKYDDYDAINIDDINNIPDNYYEPMGVPVSFLDYYNNKQFEIIDILHYPKINNKKIFKRIIIRRVKDE